MSSNRTEYTDLAQKTSPTPTETQHLQTLKHEFLVAGCRPPNFNFKPSPPIAIPDTPPSLSLLALRALPSTDTSKTASYDFYTYVYQNPTAYIPPNPTINFPSAGMQPDFPGQPDLSNPTPPSLTTQAYKALPNHQAYPATVNAYLEEETYTPSNPILEWVLFIYYSLFALKLSPGRPKHLVSCLAQVYRRQLLEIFYTPPVLTPFQYLPNYYNIQQNEALRQRHVTRRRHLLAVTKQSLHSAPFHTCTPMEQIIADYHLSLILRHENTHNTYWADYTRFTSMGTNFPIHNLVRPRQNTPDTITDPLQLLPALDFYTPPQLLPHNQSLRSQALRKLITMQFDPENVPTTRGPHPNRLPENLKILLLFPKEQEEHYHENHAVRHSN